MTRSINLSDVGVVAWDAPTDSRLIWVSATAPPPGAPSAVYLSHLDATIYATIAPRPSDRAAYGVRRLEIPIAWSAGSGWYAASEAERMAWARAAGWGAAVDALQPRQSATAEQTEAVLASIKAETEKLDDLERQRALAAAWNDFADIFRSSAENVGQLVRVVAWGAVGYIVGTLLAAQVQKRGAA